MLRKRPNLVRGAATLWLLGACSSSAPAPTAPSGAAPSSAAPVPVPAAPASPTAGTQTAASASPPSPQAPAPVAQPTAAPAPATPRPCPDDMVFVDAAFCPDTAAYDGPERRCLSRERNRPNNITICNRFAEGTRCRTKTRRQRFCIDRYEYPNRKDAHPPVMVSAYDGAALCAERGKRLCWESEWMAACEGPGQLPFPYGYERSAEHCNIDNRWRQPSLRKVYSDDRAVREAELKRLDQSVPSGAKPGCKSGFGVHDLTGNFDEWVMTEWRRGTSDWAGLKGGAWGHVRNACRPITTSHSPQFTYYFISFRCCSDPEPAALEASKPDDNEWKPPPVPDKALKKKNKPHRGWPAEPAPR